MTGESFFRGEGNSTVVLDGPRTFIFYFQGPHWGVWIGKFALAIDIDKGHRSMVNRWYKFCLAVVQDRGNRLADFAQRGQVVDLRGSRLTSRKTYSYLAL